MCNQDMVYNQHSLLFWETQQSQWFRKRTEWKNRQKTGVKEIKEEALFTSEMCSSTSLSRWRTLVMKWTADWQEGGGTGGSAPSSWGFVSACARSTCLSFTTENGCGGWSWGWGLGRVFGGRRANCCAAFLILTSNWKGQWTCELL